MLAFFFSSRRRHTRYWRDWSSDVCSPIFTDPDTMPAAVAAAAERFGRLDVVLLNAGMTAGQSGVADLDPAGYRRIMGVKDRKSVVEGKSVDLGGRRIIKKKKRRTRMWPSE